MMCAHCRNKGLAEKDLASFAFEDFIVFRPSFITGAHFRFSDIYMRCAHFLSSFPPSLLTSMSLPTRPFAGVVSVFHPEISVPVRLCCPPWYFRRLRQLTTPSLFPRWQVHTLTQSMAFAGELGSAQLRADDKTTDSWDGPSFTAVSSAQMKRVVNRVYM